MSDIPQPEVRDLDQVPPRLTMSVTNHDRLTATMTAALIMVGLVVSILFVLWLTTRVWIRKPAVVPELIEPLAGGGNAMGNARELVEPGQEEMDEFDEPQLEETIDSITDAVTDQLATLDAVGGESPTMTAGGGAGDSRVPGPGNSDANLIPRWQRWRVQFSANSSQIYVKQLDAFGIEIAATGGSVSSIDYVSHLSEPKPKKRSALASDEERLYMTYKFGPLKALDEQLLKNNGIKTENRILLQFFPAETENRLALAEKAYMDERDRKLEQIESTTFGVSSEGGRYTFYVKEQVLR
jgi:hypothetical protein